MCVGAEDHRFLVGEAMADAKVRGPVILEPSARNTAAAMALAALGRAPEQMLLFCPADHHIPDVAAFAALVEHQTVRPAGRYRHFRRDAHFPQHRVRLHPAGRSPR